LVLGDYAAPLDAIVRALKYRGWFFLGEQLGRRLAVVLAPRIGPVDAVVAVPAARWRRLSGRLDHAGVLAAAAADTLGLKVQTPLARRGRLRLTGLTAGARRRARLGYVLREGHRVPRRILLVDDVFTTGSTLARCTNLLRRAGAQWVVAVAVARTPPPGALGTRLASLPLRHPGFDANT
jgi:predicted amidophosphoribosyltransferase